MKRLLYCVSGFLAFISVTGYAAKPADLNSIVYQLHTQRWVMTDKANVVIAVDATAKDQDLPNVQQHQIMQKLNQLGSHQKWDVVTFDRNQDQSGLEKLHMVVSARLPESQLNNFRDRVQSLSKAGEKFQLQTINFEPSLIDVEKTREQLRQEIYEQVKQELAQLNKTYPAQHYFLHNINFVQQPIYRMAGNAFIKTNVPSPSDISVKREMTVNAVVVLASKIKN